MSKLDKQFLEDRELRNAALAALKDDITHLKTGLSGKGLAERTVRRIGTGAKDALGDAGEAASDNRGIIAALFGAIALWFARGPILEGLGLELIGAGKDGNEIEEDLEAEAPEDDTLDDGKEIAEIEIAAEDAAPTPEDAPSETIPGDDND